MTLQQFNPINTELLTGINLIEASAGTGKTYAIAMLVLRFVVEEGYPIEQLLVVTFTKAATEELKDRIRARLAEAKRAVNGQTAGIDKTILAWLNQLTTDKKDKNEIKQRLTAALLTIDQAGIFTIHGFCQRVLTEHALESGQLFDLQLTTDIQRLKQDCTDDFWRREVYLRTELETALLTNELATPDALLASVNAVSLNNRLVPDFVDLNQALSEVIALMNQAAQQLSQCVSVLQTGFAEGKFKESYQDTFEKNRLSLQNWLAGNTPVLPDPESLMLFSSSSLLQGLNGQKFRATKQQTGEERKREYLTALGLDNQAFDELAFQIKQLTVFFRRALLEDLRKSLSKRLQADGLLSFDDLISRLATALQQDRGILTHALQQRFRVALIDEFQDTDPQQWAIFSKLFGTKPHTLYLIGDPKQAIYKFRGADIFAYLAAQKKAEHRFSLGKNWRSHPQLVEAVNHLFKRPAAFLFPELEFHPVSTAKTLADGYLSYKNQTVATFMLWQLAQSDSETGDWTSGKAAAQIQQALVNEAVSLLNDDFKIKQQRVQPKHIAVLVRTNAQARDYQTALQQAGVPAVLNNTESVYASMQAVELYQLLQVIADPSDSRLLKQALSLDWFGLNGQQFYQLLQDEAALDQWTTRLQHYHQRWQALGLMSMMRELLVNEQILQILSGLPQAERGLTNLYHLLELLQQVEQEQGLSVPKTVTYLAMMLQEETGGVDEQQLRLESDADAVKIVTMHRSKGLEYEIVFCPVLWQSDSRLQQEKQLISCHQNGQMLSDLGSEAFETHKKQAIYEQAAEELRVCYVALTRAKYRCYLAWANVRSKEQPNQSPLAYLFDFAEDSFMAQQAKLKNFHTEQPEVFAYSVLSVPQEITATYRLADEKQPLTVKLKQRKFYPVWQMTSYTALASSSSAITPELPMDKAQENESSTPVAEPLLLPKGSHTGNVIHNLLEFNSFKKLADPAIDISAQRDKTCARFGLQLAEPEVIDTLLRTVVSTPLSASDENFCLKNISAAHCLKEMPFYLALQPLQMNHVNLLLQHCPTYQPLLEKKLAGYLTGFVDLICQYDGRYYVMDYKTNALSDYQPHSLTAAMREHNYGLQYWLYSVVLHLYLQNRLPNYSYQHHFGGVRYLFVRGMQQDVPMSGVYAALPDLQTLEALCRVLISH